MIINTLLIIENFLKELPRAKFSKGPNSISGFIEDYGIDFSFHKDGRATIKSFLFNANDLDLFQGIVELTRQVRNFFKDFEPSLSTREEIFENSQSLIG